MSQSKTRNLEALLASLPNKPRPKPRNVIVDADGMVLNNPPKPRPLKRTKVMRFQVADTNRLEEAIYSGTKPHPMEKKPFRLIFHETYRDINTIADDDFEAFLDKFYDRKERTLRYCWYKLGWRPNEDNSEVEIKLREVKHDP